MKTYSQSVLTLLALTQIIQTQLAHGQSVGSTNVKVSQVNQKIKLININTASLKDLEYLPGIGKTLAIRIMERRKIKPFQFVQDLKYVDGIGEKKFGALKSMIRVK